MKADVFVIGAKPRLGKTALLQAIALAAAVLPNGASEDLLDVGQGKFALGKGNQANTIIIGACGDGEAQPMGGMGAVDGASHGVGQTGGLEQSIKLSTFSGDSGSLCAVGDQAHLTSGEMDHAADGGDAAAPMQDGKEGAR